MGSKTTFIIKDEIIMQVKEAVKCGYYKSLTSFVENALKNELSTLKKAEIRTSETNNSIGEGTIRINATDPAGNILEYEWTISGDIINPMLPLKAFQCP